jgi:hypothetical protein
MDKRLFLAGVIVIILAIFVIGAAASASGPPAGKSISYYLKWMDASLIGGGSQSSASSGIWVGSAKPPEKVVCSASTKLCASKDVVLAKGLDGSGVFRVTIPTTAQNAGVGENFSLDFSDYNFIYKVGVTNQSKQQFGQYVFTLSGNDGRFMIFDVKKSDGSQIDCYSPLSASSIKSNWATIKASASHTNYLELLKPSWGTYGSQLLLPGAGPQMWYALRAAWDIDKGATKTTLLFDTAASNYPEQPCFDTSLDPQASTNLNRTPIMKVNLVAVNVENSNLVLDFKIKLLINNTTDAFTSNLPNQVS